LYKKLIKADDSHLNSYLIEKEHFVLVFRELEKSVHKENMLFSSIIGVLTEVSDSCDCLLLAHTLTFQHKFEGTWVMKLFISISKSLEKLKNTADHNQISKNFNILDDIDDFKPRKRLHSSLSALQKSDN
jgi:hypothetical protein